MRASMAPRAIVVVAAVTAGTVLASSAGAVESTIYPGVGIGKVKLGMSAARVTKAMGRDFIVNKRETVNGVHYVEYGWNFAHWTVTFAQRGRALTAVQVATDLNSQHTANGIGMGTKWRAVLHAFPGGRCAWGHHYQPWGVNLEYLVPHKGGTQTMFTFGSIVDTSTVPARLVGYKVVEVRVREPFEQYVEFTRDAQPYNRCADGWQKTDIPDYQRG
jgi:hypothetical protein